MIYILLPCYNEYENLKILITKINKFSIKIKQKLIIIVVNDGSTDQTNNEINFLKKKSKNKILYLIHKKNLGLNMAMYTGLNSFLKNAKKKDILISLDSDNTHPIPLIEKMLKLMKINNLDVVIASRFQNGSNIQGLSLFRKILSEGARLIFKNIFSIKNVEDYTCNYRAYKYSVLKKSNLIKKDFFQGKDFSIIADLLINLDKKINQIKIKEVPLSLRYDFKIGESKLNVTKNIFKTLILVLRNML
tara:strand:+ start:4921 stop:5661 length:741 start_codon:yes stop_codon:yes gene_type:complete